MGRPAFNNMLVFYSEIDAAAQARFTGIPVESAPAAYRERLARKTHPQALAESQAGLWLLQKALAHTGYDVATIAGIGFGAHGQPQLPGGPAFSISHSGAYAACALSDTRAVGLDIEAVRPIVPGRLARLMSVTERAVVEHDPARFFDYWCAREAAVKATGRVGLKRVRQVRLEAGRAWLDDRYWPLSPLTLAPGLAGCIASDAAIDAVQVIGPLQIG